MVHKQYISDTSNLFANEYRFGLNGQEKTGAITFDVIDIGANGISSFNGFSKITKLASEKPVIESIKTGANSIIDLKSAEDGVKNLTNDFKK